MALYGSGEELIKRDFELEADPDFAGQVKSSGDRYGPSLSNSGFPMTYAIVNVVHGRWKPLEDPPTSTERRQPLFASLIVIRFELSRLTSRGDRRFVSFNPTLRLEADPYTEPKHDPWVAHFEPAGKGARYITESQSDITHEKAFEINANLQAPPPIPISGGGKYTDTKSEAYKKITRYVIGSGRSISQSRGAGRNGPDKIWWNLTEEEGKGAGVGDRLQVAVLLQRNSMRDFKIHLTLKSHVDTLHSITKAFKTNPFHSRNIFEETFSPSVPNDIILDGVDPNHLALTETDGRRQILEELAFEHSAELWKPVPQYSEATKVSAVPAAAPDEDVFNPLGMKDTVDQHPATMVKLVSDEVTDTGSSQGPSSAARHNEVQIEANDEDEDEEMLQLKLAAIQAKLQRKRLTERGQNAPSGVLVWGLVALVVVLLLLLFQTYQGKR